MTETRFLEETGFLCNDEIATSFYMQKIEEFWEERSPYLNVGDKDQALRIEFWGYCIPSPPARTNQKSRVL